MTTVFEQRYRECQESMATAEVDGVVLFPSPTLFYVSGFREEPGERHLFLVIPRTGQPLFIAPKLYEEQLTATSWVEDIRSWADSDDPTELLESVFDELDMAGGYLLLDDRMWARFTLDIRAVAPEATWGLASEIFDDCRIRKDDAEIEALQSAGKLADEVSESIRSLGTDAIGLTEHELAEAVDARLSDGGGERISFETIVAAGPNGALPHHRHGDRKIQPGEPVVLDFGADVEGYPGDQTRTVVFDGEPEEEFQRAFEAVREGQQAAIEAVEPGVTAETIDAAARSVIEEAGYGDEFVHRTGHGVGLEVHEAPYIVEGNDTILEPGMVFSIEPGVYISGEFGVRIEDLIVVTEDGCERLNTSPRTWKPL